MRKVIKGFFLLLLSLSLFAAIASRITGYDFTSLINKDDAISTAKQLTEIAKSEVTDLVDSSEVTDVLGSAASDLKESVVPALNEDLNGVSEDIAVFEDNADDTNASRVEVYVERVVDGDTFITQEGQRVRLIGIDTPESVAPEEYLERTGKENTEAGKDASGFTKSLIEGQTVYLEFDAAREDKYGRLLAYVYLADGTMVQDILLQNGYAQLMTIQPNVKYADHFVEVISQTRS